jgi:hypothetical protein
LLARGPATLRLPFGKFAVSHSRATCTSAVPLLGVNPAEPSPFAAGEARLPDDLGELLDLVEVLRRCAFDEDFVSIPS